MEKRINIKRKERVQNNTSGLELSGIFNHWLVKIASVVISVIILVSVFNSIKITIQKLDILKQAQREVEELRLTNLHLTVGIKDMSTDKYLEKEARDRLNFGDKEEIVFVIPKNALDLAKEEVTRTVNTTEEVIYEEGNNMEDWIAFVRIKINKFTLNSRNKRYVYR